MALGQGRTAEVHRDARIGEAQANMEAGIKVSHQKTESRNTCFYQFFFLILLFMTITISLTI